MFPKPSFQMNESELIETAFAENGASWVEKA